ncbi:MAG: hypothetical protein ACI35S_01070 [Anaeroplasma sp.]
MKASQYLYTSWKNAPNHGYSIYSTSGDIKNEDLSVIQAVMKYPSVNMMVNLRRQRNLPPTYVPTEEDIEKYCPRNFAYFALPSGKYCMAQSVYIGPEYKGFTPSGRTGNYLVHAFVFEPESGFVPASYIGSDIFRRDLTLDEWTATNPPLLPIVDLKLIDKDIAQGEITGFLSKDNNLDIFKKLLSSITNKNNNLPIYLNDKLENMVVWYKVISKALPNEVLKTLTFNTYSLDDLGMSVVIPVQCKPKIQTISGDDKRAKYQLKLQSASVFDIIDSLYSPNLIIDEGVNLVVNIFINDVNKALEFNREIIRIRSNFNVTINDVEKIINFEKQNYYYFKTSSELNYVIDVYSRRSDIRKYSKPILDYILTNTYPVDDDLLKIIKKIYDNLSSIDKVSVSKYIFNMLDSIIISKTNVEYANEVYQKVPYIIENILEIAPILPISSNYVTQNYNSINKVYFYIAAIINNDKKINHDELLQFINQIHELISSLYIKKDFNSAESLTEILVKLDPNAQEKIINKEFQRTLNLNDFRYSFQLIAKVSGNTSLVKDMIIRLIQVTANKEDLYNNYENFISKNSRFAALDRDIRNSIEAKEFFTNIEIIKFKKNMTPTEEALNKFYTNYYLRGLDSEGLFLSKLWLFINSKNDRDKIQYASKWLILIEKNINNSPSSDELDFFRKLLKIFKIDTNKKNQEFYDKEINILKKYGISDNTNDLNKFINVSSNMKLKEIIDSLEKGTFYNHITEPDGTIRIEFQDKLLSSYLKELIRNILSYKEYVHGAYALSFAILPFYQNRNFKVFYTNIMKDKSIDRDMLVTFFMIITVIDSSKLNIDLGLSSFLKRLVENYLLALNKKQKEMLVKFISKKLEADKSAIIFKKYQLQNPNEKKGLTVVKDGKNELKDKNKEKKKKKESFFSRLISNFLKK